MTAALAGVLMFATLGGDMPLRFVANRGELDPGVSYHLQGRRSTVYLTPQGMTFALTGQRQASTVALDFLGARRGTRPEGERPTAAGSTTYATVVYREVWPGIDVSAAGTASGLEYTFVVRPGANPQRIRLRYRGASSVKLDASGALEVATPTGGLRDQAPFAYQEIDGRRVEVASAYSTRQDGADFVYSFKLGRYDHTRTLVIDPVVVVYCGYIAGNLDDEGQGIAVDAAGNAYVAGYTRSTEATFPVAVGPDLSFNGGTFDAFVAAVKADGTGFIYVGYIGGSGDFDLGVGIAADTAGNAYVTGYTESTEATFPVTAIGPDATYNGGSKDAFVAEVQADGTNLVYAGYVGGGPGGGSTGDDFGSAIAVDPTGNAYVTGETSSLPTSFPVLVGPDLTYSGGLLDAFVAEVKADGTGLVYAGYVGGSGDEYGRGIAVDASGSAYVTGETTSKETSFPVTIGPSLTYGGGSSDAYVAKLTADGTALVYAGYIGGKRDDYSYGIGVDIKGNAYVSGKTNSDETTFPVLVGPTLTYNGGVDDAFVAKVMADGTGLAYAGYIGGAKSEGDSGLPRIAVDPDGNAYVSGDTTSDETTFPVTAGPDLTYNGSGEPDAFVARVRAGGGGFDYAGYIGGSLRDWAQAIAVDGAGNAYVTGATFSNASTFPVKVGPDPTFKGGSRDGFVAKVAVMTCALNKLVPPDTLRGVKEGKAARFTWGPDSIAQEYHLNAVAKRDYLRETDPTSPRQTPVGEGQTRCTAAAPNLSCTDGNAFGDPATLLFYQVLSACGSSGAEEGPICTTGYPCP